MPPIAEFSSLEGLRDDLVSGGRRSGADCGDPMTAYAELFDRAGVEAGLWTCTPGGWDIEDRADTEVVLILSGSARITDRGGEPRPVGPGDCFVLPKGWSGRWEIIEKTEKMYVIVTETETP